MGNDAGYRLVEEAAGGALPESFRSLSENDARALAELLESSRVEQQEQLQKALEHALSYLPRMVRGPVRRILFPKS